MTSPVQRHQLFISYSHKDRAWVDRLCTMLRPLEHRYGLERWDDSRIQAGMLWRDEIEKALASAQVALLLVSADFLASDYVTRSELPPLFHAAKQEGLRILWVPLRPCLWKLIPEIEQYQAAIPPGRTLAQMAEVEQEEALVGVAEQIQVVFQEEAQRRARETEERERQEAERKAESERLESERLESERLESERLAREQQERQRQNDESTSIKPEDAGSQGEQTSSPWPLQPITTTQGWLVKEAGGWQVNTKPAAVRGFQEELAPGVMITMLRIPAGSFKMGSAQSEEERFNDEGPHHEVNLLEFFLAQTPITHKQWRVVAGLEKVERDLELDPSNFKGSSRPVEKVSWHDAVEFCRRLTKRTGKRYGLPSETQWEYACRAGTSTPFHFGDTLTAELANYDATSTYGNGPKGIYRKQTTDVASFPANAWGLHDMHGNVWEWCEDFWHESYQGAPCDGRPWSEPQANAWPRKDWRQLRGGSWCDDPVGCRSAYRFGGPPGSRDYYVGFRVCCLPPGHS
jgi:formylglycine-generating enzyme required for sulfatase activity